MNKSLLIRLTALYAIAFSLVASIGFTVFYYRLYSVTIERMDEELLENAEVYSEWLASKGLESLRDRIGEQEETEDPEEEFFRIINLEGEILAATDMSSWGEVDRQGAFEALKKGNTGHVARTITINRRDIEARMVSAVIGQDLVLQLGETLEETDEYLDNFRTLLAILIAILVMASTVIGWLLARKSLADMQAVTRAAEDIAKGSYDRRVRVHGQFSEIERLGTAFNTMLDRIQNLLQSMKEINDNIAHDLRSPLARIRGIAEMTIVNDKPIEDFKEMAGSTIEECDTLIDMINTMLDLTETEAGVNVARIEEIDLTGLVLGACELFRPLAEEKHILLETRLPEHLSIHVDRRRMQRILSNLIENAIKYTPDRGTVSVSAFKENGTLRIEIEDTGSGISESDLPHIFKRFYRCDRSRSQPGVGLGLSLVKAYTESMHGTVHVKSAPDQGSVFSLRFSE